MKTKIISTMLISLIIVSSAKSQIGYSDWELVVDNQQFPEGPVWDFQGNLYTSNCYGNWITRISETEIDTFLNASDSTFSRTNGMIAMKDGSILACDYGIGAILKFYPDGKCEKLIDGFEGIPFNRPNDLTFDKNGNLYFSDPKSYNIDTLDGRLFFYDFKSGELKLVQSDLAFPNGLGISPIDSKLYLSESAKNRIDRFDIGIDGALKNKTVFIELPGGDPDGMNFDMNGNMYVAHFGSGTLFIISPQGNILHKIKTPGKKPSNVEFAGDEAKILYLTEDETNSIYKMNVSIPGFSILQD